MVWTTAKTKPMGIEKHLWVRVGAKAETKVGWREIQTDSMTADHSKLERLLQWKAVHSKLESC